MSKNIFVIGGVLSSLGKGIAASSIGFLLKKLGYTVGMQKLDPYLNVDPGTMSPFQHGEVFVTDDGYEADLDLGHYERFIGEPTSRKSNATTGQIYERIIHKERRGDFLGKTVQVVPHVTDEIKTLIRDMDPKYDFVITEIGGTVGDIESLPFLEALRQYRLEVGFENSLFVLLTYIPWVKAAGELKTKPTQHAVNKLREIGIQPDILMCRSEFLMDADTRSKIALFTNVAPKKVIDAVDVPVIYECPMRFYNDGLHARILEHFALPLPSADPDFSSWKQMIDGMISPQNEVTIAVCGKYVVHKDAYKSVESALKHAAAHHRVKLNLRWIDTEEVTEQTPLNKELANVNGILVPGGFGIRGIDGKILIARYARKNNIPFFGICLGMQVAVIEFAQDVCKLKGAYSSEFIEDTLHPVIDLMTEQKKYLNLLGGTMRLGSYDCRLKPGSMANDIYEQPMIAERHRHRYEFNNEYRKTIEDSGMVVSGTTPDGTLCEIVEIPSHPFYIGVQFHPEFKSRPIECHPVFKAFVKAAYKQHQRTTELA